MINSLFSVSSNNKITLALAPVLRHHCKKNKYFSRLKCGQFLNLVPHPLKRYEIFQCSNELFDDEYICELMTFTEDVHILLKDKCV